MLINKNIKKEEFISSKLIQSAIFESQNNQELLQILDLVSNEPIFFSNEKRLLSMVEILNYKEELNIYFNCVPLIDLYDNDFLIYNIDSKEFQLIEISTDHIYNKVDSIGEYINSINNRN